MRAETTYEKTFRRIQPLAVRLVESHVSSSDRDLRKATRLALRGQAPTEYPYVFRNSFLGREPVRGVMDTLSAAVHLVQTSTFVIDDIFDLSDQRNGNPTVRAYAGVDVAIVVGQILQSVAFSTLARVGGRERLPKLSDAIAALTDALTLVYRGQYLDLLYSSRLQTSRAEYYRVIHLTTASLFAGVSRCGALLGDRSSSEIRSLSAIAHDYGMALQITDDILDVTDESTGKTFGSDLRCRRMRLPFIIAMQNATAVDRATLTSFLKGRRGDERTIASVAGIIRRSRGISGALTIAKRYCSRSLRTLASLRASPQTDAFAWLSQSLFAAQELE